MSSVSLVAFVEGSSDEIFFPEVLRRLVQDVVEPVPLRQVDVRVEVLGNRDAERGAWVVERVDRYFRDASVIAVHVDGSAQPERELRKAFAPVYAEWVKAGRRAVMIALVPVKETEAWVLADLGVLRDVVGADWNVQAVRGGRLLSTPERLADPKATLADVVAHARRPRRRPRSINAVLPQVAQLMPLASLRRLSSFQRFESDLRQALSAVPEEIS